MMRFALLAVSTFIALTIAIPVSDTIAAANLVSFSRQVERASYDRAGLFDVSMQKRGKLDVSPVRELEETMDKAWRIMGSNDAFFSVRPFKDPIKARYMDISRRVLNTLMRKSVRVDGRRLGQNRNEYFHYMCNVLIANYQQLHEVNPIPETLTDERVKLEDTLKYDVWGWASVGIAYDDVVLGDSSLGEADDPPKIIAAWDRLAADLVAIDSSQLHADRIPEYRSETTQRLVNLSSSGRL
ncbi:hypothetical protein FRB99_001611 [Tulasnella sp. 403]|nr:hypothetical protein FRB99_001611 [Tulasnella sp. 403]